MVPRQWSLANVHANGCDSRGGGRGSGGLLLTIFVERRRDRKRRGFTPPRRFGHDADRLKLNNGEVLLGSRQETQPEMWLKYRQ